MQSEVAVVTDAYCVAVDEYYIFPDVARRVADLVRRRRADLEPQVDSDELANFLTRTAYEASSDHHREVRLWPVSAEVVSTGSDEFAAARTRRAHRLNYGVAKIERLAGNVGLLALTNFFPAHLAGDVLTSAMQVLNGTEALIVDLRRNQGGSPETVVLLISYLLDADQEPVHINDFYFRHDETTQQSWTLPHVPGRRFGSSKPVYVLTSSNTFSAAEAFAYDLQAMKRAAVVGERSRGGAHPGDRIRLDDHLAAFVPSGRAINPITGTNWQGIGVIPDRVTSAPDALTAAHASALNRLLATPRLDPELAAEAADTLRLLSTTTNTTTSAAAPER